MYFDKNIPLETTNKEKKKHPWITNGILNSIKRRNKLYKLHICDRSNVERLERYKKYRNKLTSIIRASRKSYYHLQFEKAKNNCNSTWKIIKDIFNKHILIKLIDSFLKIRPIKHQLKLQPNLTSTLQE